jgi:prepilin-type processing-associated H-X9-DG protein
MFIGMTIVAFLLGLVVWSIRYVEDLRQTERCGDNFKQAAIAILGYEGETSRFPSAYTVDARGRRMRSWRVSILPRFCCNWFFTGYRQDEPWDGPHNRKLEGEYLSHFYRCPADLSEPRTSTSVLAVVGPGTAWPGATPGCSKNCAKGASQTALLVEAANSGIHWMEPRDLELSQFDPTINSRSGRGISSNHAGGVNVVMADGSVRCLSPNTAPEVLKAMLMTGGTDGVSSGKPTLNRPSGPDGNTRPLNTE